VRWKGIRCFPSCWGGAAAGRMVRVASRFESSLALSRRGLVAEAVSGDLLDEGSGREIGISVDNLQVSHDPINRHRTVGDLIVYDDYTQVSE